MPTESFIEVVRKDAQGKLDGYCVARIRADLITAIVEVESKNGSGPEHTSLKKFVRLHLGNNNYIDCEAETLASIWNKMNQAFGRRIPDPVREVSPDYPGHPTYDEEAAA